MNNTPKLPEKCCANCGFLYGVSRYFQPREEVIFDPDIIRDREYPPLPMTARGEGKPGVISSRCYSVVYQPRRQGETNDKVYYPYTWAATDRVCCYQKKYEALHISGMHTSTRDFYDAAMQYVPEQSGDILDLIREDRADCDGYIGYLPGFTPQQHAEFRIEEIRVRRLEIHEEKLAKYTSQMEQQLRKRDWFVLLGVAIISGIFALITAVCQPTIAYIIEKIKP